MTSSVGPNISDDHHHWKALLALAIVSVQPHSTGFLIPDPLLLPTLLWLHRSLTNTGGGTGLTTTPSAELNIPFTTTATQTLTGSVGWVAGTVGITNPTPSSITITSVSLTVGGAPTQLPLAQCGATTLEGGIATSCAFNVSVANAPAAGTVTANVAYTPSGGSPGTMSSTDMPYSFTGVKI